LSSNSGSIETPVRVTSAMESSLPRRHESVDSASLRVAQSIGGNTITIAPTDSADHAAKSAINGILGSSLNEPNGTPANSGPKREFSADSNLLS
jgi:hypothetical protein